MRTKCKKIVYNNLYGKYQMRKKFSTEVDNEISFTKYKKIF